MLIVMVIQERKMCLCLAVKTKMLLTVLAEIKKEFSRTCYQKKINHFSLKIAISQCQKERSQLLELSVIRNMGLSIVSH